MDWVYDKHTWSSSEIKEFEYCLTKTKLSTSDDPIIVFKNSKTGKYVHGGINEYKCKDTAAFWSNSVSPWDRVKTGTLKLPFPNGKKIRIENVHSVIITWGKNHIDCGDKQSATLHMGLCNMIPDLEEMEDLHFAIQTVYFDPTTSKKKSDVLFFEGSTLSAEVKDISAMGDHHYGNVYYAKKKNGIYTHYIRNFENNTYIIGKSKQAKLNCEIQRYESIKKITEEIVTKSKEDGLYRFYYYSNTSTQGTVLESYLSRHCNQVKVKNYFSDDETCNYYVNVDINLVAFLKYYGSSGFAIYGIEIDDYLPYLPYESEDNWYYNSTTKMEFHKKVLSNAIETNPTQTENELMLSLENLRNRSRDVQEHVLFELYRRLLPDAMEYHNPYYDWAKKEYRAEKDYLLAENRLKSIWKGEFQMYKMAKELYPDAIYQYHCEWLGRQSLDVYIPSISVGIEYQGIQHYQPIAHFGGESAYQHRIELDNQKRQLCINNNVKLLEWRYDSPLTKNGLNKQIKSLVLEV